MYQYCTGSTVETYDCIDRHFIGAKDSVRSFRKIGILEWLKFPSFFYCVLVHYTVYKEPYRIKNFTDDAKFLIRYFADNIQSWCIDINFVTFILLHFMVLEFFKMGWHVNDMMSYINIICSIQLHWLTIASNWTSAWIKSLWLQNCWCSVSENNLVFLLFILTLIDLGLYSSNSESGF